MQFEGYKARAGVRIDRELWCSWLSRLLYTQKVLGSKPSSSKFLSPNDSLFFKPYNFKIVGFVGRMFTKETLRQREKSEKSWMHSHLAKELLQQQQIQEMQNAEDEQTILIFYKLKHLFFDENTDDEQIAALIREEPIRIVDRILVTLTQEYSQKVEDLMEPLEDELSSLRVKLKQEREKLQHYLDDNEYLKMMIDRLEEQRKDTELKLNQSQDEFERSKEEIIFQYIEKEKLRNQAFKLFENYQEVFDKYNEMRETILQNDRELNTLRESTEKYKVINEELTAKNKYITTAICQLNYENHKIKGENERFRQKIAYQEEKITNFVDNYNKCNIYPKAFGVEQNSGDEKEELGEFIFDKYEKDQIFSRRSSSRVSELCQLEAEVDSKFLAINATAAKIDIMTSMKNVYESQGKKHVRLRLQSSHSRRAKAAVLKNATLATRSKVVVKTFSSRKFMTREQPSHRTPSDNDDAKLIPEPLLRKKLAEKNQMIYLLEAEVRFLKDQYMEISERITETQGGYELQLDELNNQLRFTKQNLNELTRDYLLMKVLSESYQQKIGELESEMKRLEEQHAHNSAEVKKRCKAYIIKRIDQIEKQYQMMLERSSQNRSHPDQQEQQIQQQEAVQQVQTEYHSQQVIEEEVKMSASSVRKIIKEEMLEESDLHSYQGVENHYINGLNLDLEFSSHLKESGCNPNVGEIYIQQRFEIQSDLQNFTDRLNEDEVKRRQPGIFTERQNFIDSMLSFNIQESSITERKLNLSLNSQIYDQSISIVEKPLTFIDHSSISNSADLKKLNFHAQVEEFYQPSHKKSQISIHPTYNELVSLPKEKKHEFIRTFDFMKPQKRDSILSFETCLNEYIQASKKQNLLIWSSRITVQIDGRGRMIQQTAFNHLAGTVVQKKQNTMQTDRQRLHFTGKCLHYALESESKYNMSDAGIQSDQIDSRLSLVKISSFSLVNEAYNLWSISPVENKLTPSTYESEVQSFKIDKIKTQKIEELPIKIVNNDTKQIKQAEIQKQESIYNLIHQTSIAKSKSEKQQLNKLSFSVKSKSNNEVDKSYAEKQKENYQDPKEIQKSILINSPSLSVGVSQNSFAFADLLNQSEDLQPGPRTSNLNPQSKSNKGPIESRPDINTSPWYLLLEGKKGNQMQKTNQIYTFPQQIHKYLGDKTGQKLFKYLQKKNIQIREVQIIDRKHFKKPHNISQKLLLLTVRKAHSYSYFALNSRKIFNIETLKQIRLEKACYIDANNFMFGQSEVIVTSDGCLLINRKGKRNTLVGDLSDGEWTIESYMVCSYRVVK